MKAKDRRQEVTCPWLLPDSTNRRVNSRSERHCFLPQRPLVSRRVVGSRSSPWFPVDGDLWEGWGETPTTKQLLPVTEKAIQSHAHLGEQDSKAPDRECGHGRFHHSKRVSMPWSVLHKAEITGMELSQGQDRFPQPLPIYYLHLFQGSPGRTGDCFGGDHSLDWNPGLASVVTSEGRDG